MKKILLTAILASIVSLHTHAQDYSSSGFDLIAPIIYDVANAPKQVGSIVYDSANNTFSGNAADGSWVLLSTSNSVKIENKSAAITYPGVAGSWYDIASINLPAGTWQINAQASYNSSAGNQEVRIAVGTTVGNSDTGLTEGDNMMKAYFDSAATVYVPIYLNSYIVEPTVETTYKLKVRVGSNVSGMTIAYKINAIRSR